MDSGHASVKIACLGCRQKLDLSDVEPFSRVACPRCGGMIIAPKRFGPLLLEEPLGRRGGVASYRALDLTLDREVEVQILEWAATSLRDAFLALARQSAPVSDPGVIPIYSAGTHEGTAYVVREYLSGGPLAGRLADRAGAPIPARQGLAWVLAAGRGLRAAAGHGVTHGAVSPWSIRLDADGRAKLGDFGVDLLLSRAEAGPDPAWLPALAPYLSPEVRDGGPPTPAADVFGLGAVLYHVLTGSAPGAPGSGPARQGVGSVAPRPPAGILPAPIWDLCLAMLNEDPRRRPGDLEGLLAALAAASAAAPVPEAGRAGVAAPATTPAPGSRPELARTARRAIPVRQAPGAGGPARRRWADVLIAAALAAAIALAAVAYVRRHGWPAWLVGPAPTGASPPAEEAPRTGR